MLQGLGFRVWDFGFGFRVFAKLEEPNLLSLPLPARENPTLGLVLKP